MKTEKILDTKAESFTCTYRCGDFVQFTSRVQSLMSCVVAVNRVERLRSIGCRHHVDDLVVPVVTQLNRVPAILLLHSLPISWIQIYRKKTCVFFPRARKFVMFSLTYGRNFFVASSLPSNTCKTKYSS